MQTSMNNQHISSVQHQLSNPYLRYISTPNHLRHHSADKNQPFTIRVNSAKTIMKENNYKTDSLENSHKLKLQYNQKSNNINENVSTLKKNQIWKYAGKNAALNIKNKCSFINRSVMTPKRRKIFQSGDRLPADNKIIHSFQQVQTVQSKYSGQSGSLRVQESQVIFKGSRDIGNIKPIRLMYGDEDYVTNKENIMTNSNQTTEYDSKHNHILTNTYKFDLIRHTSSHTRLIRQLNSLTLYGIVQLTTETQILQLQHKQIVRIFHKIPKNNNQKCLIIIQPYQYTLQQLISMKSITNNNIDHVLSNVYEGLCMIMDKIDQIEKKQIVGDLSEYMEKNKRKQNNWGNFNSRLEFIQQFYHNIVYIHGEFKLIPVYKRGKQDIGKVMSAIRGEILRKI